MSRANNTIVRMVELAVLTALVIILQFAGGALTAFLPVPISLVLIPITMGGMLLGPGAGAWLGFVFGTVTFVCGITGFDQFTAFLLTTHPVLVTIICYAKAILAGLCSALIFKAFVRAGKGDSLVASLVAAGITPIVNTGVFIIGCFFMTGTMQTLIDTTADPKFVGATVAYYIFIGLAGINFVTEFLLNTVLSPALNRIYRVVGAKIG